MSEEKAENIISQWSNTILQGKERVSFKEIKTLEIPEKLMKKIVEMNESILSEQIDLILDNPFFDFTHESNGKAEIKQELHRLLIDRVSLPAKNINYLVTETFKIKGADWKNEPISYRQAAEDELAFAEEIFRRIESYTDEKPEEGRYKLDIIAEVCELSSLESIAQAIRLEGEFNIESLNIEELYLITKRFLRLSKHFRVERQLIAYEGAARTLHTKPPKKPAAPPIQKTPKQMIEELPIREGTTPIEETSAFPDIEADIKILTESVKKELAENVQQETVPVELPDDAAAEWENIDIDLEAELKSQIKSDIESSDDQTEQQETGSDTEAYDKFMEETLAEEKAEEIQLLEDDEGDQDTGIIEGNSNLLDLLTNPNNANQFVEKLFEGDENGFQMMVTKICNAPDLNRALIIADNELFMLDIPSTSKLALRLLNTIRAHFCR